MNLALAAKARQFIQKHVRHGRYASAEDVVQAGLAALEQQEEYGDFAPGEMEQLLGEGERSIEREGTVSATEVFADLKRRRARHRGPRNSG